MTTEILKATTADLDLVVPLFDAYRQFYGCSPDSQKCRAFLTERLERNESAIFVAITDGRGLGFTQLYPIFSSIGCARAWILNDLYVSPEARRKGVGRRLMEAARKFGIEQEAAWLELETAKDNEAAKALYRSLGYVLDEEYDRLKLKLCR